MKARASFFGLAFLAVLVAWTWFAVWRLSSANARHDENLADLDALISARAELEASVLAARAGILQNFDAINRSVRSLRAASGLASSLRSQGREYAPAADIVDHEADTVKNEEAVIERFKTNLALLRLASRSFPGAADALSYCDDARVPTAADAGVSTAVPDAGTNGAPAPCERLARKVALLRTDVEVYVDSPRREVAERSEHDIQALEELQSELDPARQGQVGALLGHARAILDHRPRVDLIARDLVTSTGRADGRAAFEEFERVARHDSAMEAALRIAAAELLALFVLLLGALVWRTRWR
jgi:hypothetical protein